MRPAREGDIPVRVKNSYNPNAPGTLITGNRDMSKVCSGWLVVHVDFYHEIRTGLIIFVLTAGGTHQHCFETECHHVGYC